MNLQILKVIIWPKTKTFPPRVVEFKENCVNVITGASRTGKSAIIPIVDYCLASSDCYIPIDTIRDHASWYGVVFRTDSEQLLICRKVPQGSKSSNEFYLNRGKIISIPNEIEKSNEKAEGIKQVLNAISSVPYFSLDGSEGNANFQARLGFRDLMALVFQSQEVVANQSILFYKTHKMEHKERLRNWFPYILGAENMETLAARQELTALERRLNQLKKEAERASKVSSSWMSNMHAHIKVAKEYGIFDEEVPTDTSPEDLLEVAKRILEVNPDYIKTNVKDVEKNRDLVSTLEKENEELAIDIGLVKKRLNDVANLKKGIHEYGDSVKKRVERLHISQWIEDIAVESRECPACGSSEHPRSSEELKKISSAFRKYEQESKSMSDIPNSFDREESFLKEKLKSLIDTQSGIQGQLNILLAKDKEALRQFHQKKSMFQFLGHFRASVETFETLAEGGKFNKDISELEERRGELLKAIDPEEVQKKINRALRQLSQKMLSYLKGLDVDDKYRKVAPRFSIKDLNIFVQSDSGNWHFLAEVGSASNWVSFHLALMCALQEFFHEQSTSNVPSFVVFDQPSQVYFPKVKRTEKDKELDHKIEDEDVDAVQSMFKILAGSTSSFGWQSIVLDHADSDIYGEIKDVHEVEVWRDGNKLIPETWYKS